MEVISEGPSKRNRENETNQWSTKINNFFNILSVEYSKCTFPVICTSSSIWVTNSVRMSWEGYLTHKAETKKYTHNFWKGSFGKPWWRWEDINLVVEDIVCTYVDRFIWLRTRSRCRILSPFHFTTYFICSFSDNTVSNSDCKMSNTWMTIKNG